MKIICSLRNMGYGLLMVSILTTSCKNDSMEEPKPAESSYQLVGKVTDPQGRPLPGANLYAYQAGTGSDAVGTRSDTNGNYQLSLPAGKGLWSINGSIRKSYNNRVYQFWLDREQEEPFLVEDKPVRNLKWHSSFVGGTVWLLRDPESIGLENHADIEFTFKPVGPLVDGSVGKTLVVPGKSPKPPYDIVGIPIGRYEISAVHKPTGQALRVGDAWVQPLQYQPKVILDFAGMEDPFKANAMGIAFTNR